MKKLLLSLGALSAVVAPVAAVVACGSHHTDSKLDTIKKAAISSLDQFKGLSDEAKTTAINAINAAKDQAGVEAATQAATKSTQPGTPAQPEATTQPEAPKTDAEVKSELKDMVADILTRTSYVMDGAEQNKLVEELFKLDGSKELATLDILAGKLQDKTHGKDDFMVLIGGSDREEVTATDGFDYLAATATPESRLTLEGVPIAADMDESSKTLGDRWGQHETEVKDANFVLFLQHDDTSNKVTVQLSKIFEFDGKTWQYENLESKVQTKIDKAATDGSPVTFNAEEHSLLEFTATKA